MAQLSGEFHWFIGTVVDTADPLKLGRVKVRIFNEHANDLGADELDWASVMTPTTGAALQGAGDSPSLYVGSSVMGFYIDGAEKQLTMITGSFPSIPNNENARHGVSALARGESQLQKQQFGFEPENPYRAEYPFNRTITTRSGHAIELDDTPGQERVHIFHKSGSYIEMHSDGTTVLKSERDAYEVVVNNKSISIGGDVLMRVVGNCTAQIDGNMTTNVKGNLVTNVVGDEVHNISGNLLTNVSGDASFNVAGRLKLNGMQGADIGSGSGITLKAAGGVVVPEGSMAIAGTLAVGAAATGTFTSATGQIVSVQRGIVTSIS